MKTILVPCDFSAPSVQAFRFAVEIAIRGGGEVHLLHVIELPKLGNQSLVVSFQQSYLGDLKDEAEKNFKKIISKWGQDERIKTSIRFGGLLNSIQETAKKIKADVLVAGTHGASGLREYTVGSNAEKLVRTMNIPVIAVKKVPRTVKNIVYPTRPELDLEEMTMKVKELQHFYKATIHILYVNTPAVFRKDLATKSDLADFAKRFMLKNFTLNIYNDISEEDGIINFSKQVKADMVAMRTHGRVGLAHLATGSIAEDVVNHIECPIWTFKLK